MSRIMQQSMQSLMLTMRFNGLELSTGTGFLVDTAIGISLITNRHNVTGRNQITGETLSPTKAIPNEIVVHHSVGTFPGFLQWEGKVEPLYDDGTTDGIPLWKEHPKYKGEVDFVLLPLTQVEGARLMPYSMKAGAEILLLPTEIISVIGFPFGFSVAGRLAIWATGFIASDPDIDFDDLPLLLIDCRTREGQSGSPVIAQRNGVVTTKDATAAALGPMHRFVGIYSGRINKDSDIGMVWKASAIQELIDSLNPKITLFKLWQR